MEFPDIILSKSDFINCCWRDIVENSTKKTCFNYSQSFWKKVKEAEENGDDKLKLVFGVLIAITSPRLKSESKDEPFQSMNCIDNIKQEHLTILKEWVEEISDCELKARIADICWIRNKKEYKLAQIAINSYLESAKLLEDPIEWTFLVDRVERAIRLARSANQKTQADKIISYIEQTLLKYNGEDPFFLSARLMEILQEFKKGDPSVYAPLAEKLASSSKKEHNWHKARIYWEIVIGWYRKSKNSVEEYKASVAYAKTYVKEAKDKIKQVPPNYFLASLDLVHAIEAFRKTIEYLNNINDIDKKQKKIKKIKNLAEKLELKLVNYQQKSTQAMQSFSSEVDMTNSAEKTIDIIKGKTLHEAILTLAVSILRPTPFLTIKEQTEQQTNLRVFQQIFTPIYINEMGKTIGYNPSIEDQTYELAVLYQQADAQGIIEPARYQILLEHHVKASDFIPIVTNNPFVPKGREEIYIRALYSGLIGDFLVAGHLLIPQIENSIRSCVKRQGAITSWLDNKIQDEYIMSALFEKRKSEMEAIFGIDITFHLIALLNRKGFGSNLRNLMAHGLLSYPDFYSLNVVYLWWITLHLCCLPLIVNNREQETE